MSRLRTHAAATLAACTLTFAGAAFAQADNTNSRSVPSFSQWMSEHSNAHQGRISRDAYMREQQRRWDMMDRDRRGLTLDDINRMYGYGPNHAGPAGTNTAPGNLGPDNVKK
jgi:hypothetical protein